MNLCDGEITVESVSPHFIMSATKCRHAAESSPVKSNALVASLALSGSHSSLQGRPVCAQGYYCKGRYKAKAKANQNSRTSNSLLFLSAEKLLSQHLFQLCSCNLPTMMNVHIQKGLQMCCIVDISIYQYGTIKQCYYTLLSLANNRDEDHWPSQKLCFILDVSSSAIIPLVPAALHCPMSKALFLLSLVEALASPLVSVSQVVANHALDWLKRARCDTVNLKIGS